jgi:hypothetical protein
MKSIRNFAVPLFTASLAVMGCARDPLPTSPHAGTALGGLVATAAVYQPVIHPEDFGPTIDNPFLPLAVGTTFHYSTITGEGTETNDVIVTRDTRTLAGVRTRVIHDQVLLNGVLTEDTFDYFAQNRDGTVWYFGEDTRTLDAQGHVTGTEGSWLSGVNGGQPGIIMLAEPKVGDSYRQEFLPGVAEDMAKVLSLKSTAAVPAGTFTSCVETAEWTAIEPGVREHKFYARGVGMVLEESTRGGRERTELLSVTH